MVLRWGFETAASEPTDFDLREAKPSKMSTKLQEYLNRSLTIGNKTIASRLVLAPMTFLGHVAFRELLSRWPGCGLMYAEMSSANRIPFENRYKSDYFRWRDEERGHVNWQIYGSQPEAMARAAQRIEREGFFGVDLNYGCSAGVICQQDGGAALLKSPAKAAAIVAAVRQAVDCPVTVKFRVGWQDDPTLAVDMAKRFEQAGADAFIFHPRIAPDRRQRRPKWEYIGLIKAAVSVPVLGNGDVFSAADCLRMLEQTGCDGVAIGRIAIARPWSFAAWTAALQTDEAIYGQTARDLLTLMQQHFAPTAALRRFKRFAQYFSANFVYGHTLYSAVRAAPDLVAVEAALDRFFATPPQVFERPNRNLFS
jgi:nifR3 family TIM-barrel protein